MHESYVLSPALLDAVLQSTACAVMSDDVGGGSVRASSPQVPYALDDVWVRPGCAGRCLRTRSPCRVLVEVRSVEATMSVFNVTLFDASGPAPTAV